MMGKRVVTRILLVVFLKIAGIYPVFSQNYAGYWLGVTYPSDPNNAIFNYFGNFTQSGNTLGGTAQTANPLVAFGGLAYVKGTVTATTVKFDESDKNGSLDTPLTCYWSLDLKYDPIEESLKGTYSNIQNGSFCNEAGGGKVELYRIVLKSGTRYCKGQPVNLTVTGKNIRWYDSANKSRMIAQGNDFSPDIDQTTTYYITQTLYNTESPAIPIKIEIVDLVVPSYGGGGFASCGKQDGTITISALSTDNNIQYSIDGGATYQTSNHFPNLAIGDYKIKVKNDAGCTFEAKASVQQAVIRVKSIVPRDPTCGLANGSITVAASSASPQYSIDGLKFQESGTFNNLPAGNYTISIKDTFACAMTAKAILNPSSPVEISSAQATPTTCGEANGGIVVTTDALDVQYSVDGTNYQREATFKKMKAQTYTVMMRDALGCTDTRTVTVADSEGPVLANITLAPVSCGVANGKISVQATARSAVQYSMNGGAYSKSSSFENLAVGDYEIAVRDAENCVVLRKVTVRSDCANTIFVPTSFSPNGDGQNDQLTVHFPFPTLQFSSVRVYNRWGIAVHGSQNLMLRNGDPIWDGQLDDQTPMTENHYVVVAEVLFEDGSSHTFRKNVMVMR